MRTSMIAVVAATIGLMSNTAQAATASMPCLTEAEATALFTATMPDVIDGIAKKCATALPGTAVLRSGLAPLLDRYRPAAEAAWPQASTAFTKLAGKDLEGIDPKLVRPMIGPMVAELVGQELKPVQCPLYNRVIGGLSPLPLPNIADVVIAMFELKASTGTKSPLAICPATGKPTAAL